MNSSTTATRPQVAQRVANSSPIEIFRLDSWRGAAAIAWIAASRWRTSGGRRTISASRRVSGLDSIVTARRCRSTAARATQPPRPWRSTTTSPGPEYFSIAAATRSGGGGVAKRSKAGSEIAGSARVRESRPAMVRALCHHEHAAAADAAEAYGSSSSSGSSSKASSVVTSAGRTRSRSSISSSSTSSSRSSSRSSSSRTSVPFV